MAMALTGWRAHATKWGALVAFAVHVALALTLSSIIRRPRPPRPPAWVEVDVSEKLPIPPEPPPEPPRIEPEAPARPVVRRSPIKPPPVLPPPNRELPPAAPNAEPPTPVFGVTPESVVQGESAVAVPVGNTLMTKDRTPAKAPPAPLPPAVDPNAFAPVEDNLVCQPASKDADKFVEASYTPEARRLGIEGRVQLRLGIDRHGNVRWARVIKSVGYGLDEAAKQALSRSKFKPARTCDGRLVDAVIPWTYTFQLSE
jgi:periplasmic protein TonB